MTEEKPTEQPEPLPEIKAYLDITELVDGINKPGPKQGDSPQPEEPDKESK